MAPKNQENASMEETRDSPRPGSKDPAEPPKPTSKMIRVLTVFVYVLSVSLTAILLSIYYIFIWEGKPHLGALISPGWRNGTETRENIYNLSGSRFERYQHIDYSVTELEKTTTTDFPALNAEYYDPENMTVLLIPEGNSSDYTPEMQQQLTAVEIETNSKHVTTTTAPPEENVTWPEEYDSLEELSRSSTFIRKIMDDENYQI